MIVPRLRLQEPQADGGELGGGERVCSARVIEMASRVRLAFAAACPDATLIRHVAAVLMPMGP